MKNRIILEILLICAFGVTAWYLFGIMKQTQTSSPELKEIEENNRLMFSDGAGIDIMGNKIDSIFTNRLDETVRFVAAFLLRYDSLDSDLKFWNEVSSHLSELDIDVKLTAYCENERCIEYLKRNPNQANFTVLEYGGIVDIQAVIGADMTGTCWVRGNRYKRMKWRDGVQSPLDVSMNIGQE